MTITIEKNIPLPKESRGRKIKYPFADLEIGDSFYVGFGGRKEKTLRNTLTQCSKRCTGRKFTVRRDGDRLGLRVWRTE